MKTFDNVLDSMFSLETIEKLNAYGIYKTFEKEELVISDHFFLNNIPIVISGNIKISKTWDDGREILLYIIEPGESCVCPFFEAFKKDSVKIKAVAEKDSLVFFIPISKIDELTKHQDWLKYMFRIYQKRFDDLMILVNDITFKQIDERLMDLLRKKSALIKNNTIQITHEEVANEIGTVRVVASRMLKKMEEKGLVKLGRNKITLV